MSKRTLNTIAFDKVYKSNNYGYYKPLRIIDQKRRRVEIEFLETGYIRDVRYDHVLNGEVRDPYYPTIYDVACMGKATNNELTKYVYKVWKRMIDECYSGEFYSYRTVCKRWLCFEVFLNDVIFSLGFYPTREMHIGYGSRYVYEPSNCFICIVSEDGYELDSYDFNKVIQNEGYYIDTNPIPIIANRVNMCNIV